MAQTYYSPVTVQSGQVPSSQTDFPMLVSYTDARLKTTGNGGHVNNANGYDIRPYSDSALTTALTFELESYDATNGIVVMWVKVPTLTTTYVVYLGYGDTGLTTNGSSTSTWDTNFKAVWHLPNGTTLSGADSTSNANTGTLNNTPTAVAGKIDGGMTTNGSTQDMTRASTASIEVNTGDFMISIWLKTNANPSYGAIYDKGTSAGLADYALFMNGGTIAYRRLSGTSAAISSATTINDNVWHKIVWKRTGSSNTVYVDNTSITTFTDGGTTNNTKQLSLGLNPSTGGSAWTGSYDEFRISNSVRSADWATTEYNNESAPTTFAVLGTEVAVGGGGGSSIKTVNGLAKASVKVFNGLAIASVKSIDGLA